MVEANVRIIEELKYFLEVVSKDPSLRKLVTETEKDFTRDRKLYAPVLLDERTSHLQEHSQKIA